MFLQVLGENESILEIGAQKGDFKYPAFCQRDQAH